MGFATIEGSKADTIILDGNIKSAIENVDLLLRPENIEVYYEVSTEEHKAMFVLWKVLYLFSLNIALLFSLFVLYQIRNIISVVYRTMKTDKVKLSECVFSNNSIRRLRYIAYGFIAMPFIELLNYYLDKIFLERYIRIPDVNVIPSTSISSISWEYIFVGLLFIVMIEVFRKGLSLQEENDLTV